MRIILFTSFIFCSVISAAEFPSFLESIQWSFFSAVQEPVKVVEAIYHKSLQILCKRPTAFNMWIKHCFIRRGGGVGANSFRPRKILIPLVGRRWTDLQALCSIVKLYQKGGEKVLKNPVRAIDYLYDIIVFAPIIKKPSSFCLTMMYPRRDQPRRLILQNVI